MSKFKIGDRVIATEDYQTNGIKGKPGTIIDVNGSSTCVQFDEYMQGHNGGDKGKQGNCWYIAKRCLKLIKSASPQPFTLIIRPDKSNPDITVATLKLGKDTIRTESVTRYCKDVYDRDAAIKAVVDKMTAKPVSEVKEVKRIAMVGEYIKIVKPFMTGGLYDIGDILRVDSLAIYEENVRVRFLKRETGKVVCHDEYVVLENYTPPVSETVCSEPVKELPKPIMINGKELKVGSKFILKRYNDVTNHICIGETPWRDMCKSVLTVKSSSTTQIDVWWHDLPWIIDISAIDRIIED